MLAQENKQIAQKWFKAFNEKNLEDLLLLYDENAQHYSPKLKIKNPETNGLIKGKDLLRNWWQDAFNRLPSLNYEVKNIIADEEHVFMEYTRHVEAEEDLLVGEVLHIKNGLIIFSRVYHG